MNVSEFDFELPPELIAQEPLTERDSSRMLVVRRDSRTWEDESFRNFPKYLNPGDVIVVNNTRVFPARLLGHRVHDQPASGPGAAIETFLLSPLGEAMTIERDGVPIEIVEWEVLARPGRSLRPGARIAFGDGRLCGEVVEILDEGRRRIRFEAPGGFDRLVDEIGQTPLPPYIKRETNEAVRLVEPRYQTVYARERGAIAAPTAGLHFTPEIFGVLRQQGVDVVEVTHHVGYATFQPIRVERVEDHRIETESYEINAAAAARINAARLAGKRVIAIGTTSVRALLTNFHLPKSSLLMLVSAFAGRDTVIEAYRHAVTARYRFYSYGDCMLLI